MILEEINPSRNLISPKVRPSALLSPKPTQFPMPKPQSAFFVRRHEDPTELGMINPLRLLELAKFSKPIGYPPTCPNLWHIPPPSPRRNVLSGHELPQTSDVFTHCVSSKSSVVIPDTRFQIVDGYGKLKGLLVQLSRQPYEVFAMNALAEKNAHFDDRRTTLGQDSSPELMISIRSLLM